MDLHGRVPYQQVIDLAGKYIFANEAGVRSVRGTGQVRAWLATNGAAPEHDLKVKNGLLFDWKRVDELLLVRTGRA